MNPVTDTLSEMVGRMPEVLAAWVMFGLLPVLVPAVLAIFMKAGFSSRVKFTLSAAARLLGWPVLFLALLGLPWFIFELFLVPVILDAYPFSKSVLAGPRAVTHWMVQQSYWLVPLAWLVWVLVTSFLLRKRWEENQSAG